jgi:hypothetical protein
MRNESVHPAARVAAAFALSGALAACGPVDLGSYGFIVEQDAGSPVEDASIEACDPAACDDGDPCNGVYACQAGACVQLEPACENPDEAHCEERCDVVDGRAQCVVSARDADGDQHGDGACPAALGDDCDDAAASVYGGAPELCDGLDNDCDGKVDLDDTLALPGQNERVTMGEFPVLASSNENTFGAVYGRSGQGVFHSFKADGSDYMGTRVFSPLDPASSFVVPAIAWGRESFGIVWTRNNRVRFHELGADNLPVHPAWESDTSLQDISPADLHAGGGTVTRVGEGDWLVIYRDQASNNALFARRVTAAGERLEVRSLAEGNFDETVISPATFGDAAAALWKRSEAAVDMIEWAYGFDGVAGRPASAEQFAASSAGNTVGAPVMIAGPHGYAVAWTRQVNFASALSLVFAEIDPSGALRCGPVEIDAIRPDGRSALSPTAMVATERGYVLVGTSVRDDVYDAELLEVSTQGGCRYNQRATIAERSARKVAIARASQTGEFLLLWDQPNASDDSEIFRRSLPGTLCE